MYVVATQNLKFNSGSISLVLANFNDNFKPLRSQLTSQLKFRIWKKNINFTVRYLTSFIRFDCDAI